MIRVRALRLRKLGFHFDYISWSSVVGDFGAEADRYGDYLIRLGQQVAKSLAHAEPESLRVFRTEPRPLRSRFRAQDEVAPAESALANPWTASPSNVDSVKPQRACKSRLASGA